MPEYMAAILYNLSIEPREIYAKTFSTTLSTSARISSALFALTSRTCGSAVSTRRSYSQGQLTSWWFATSSTCGFSSTTPISSAWTEASADSYGWLTTMLVTRERTRTRIPCAGCQRYKGTKWEGNSQRASQRSPLEPCSCQRRRHQQRGGTAVLHESHTLVLRPLNRVSCVRDRERRDGPRRRSLP